MHHAKELTGAQVEQYLLDLRRHVPLGLDLGRPVAMTADGSLLLEDEPAVLTFSPSGDGVVRLVELARDEFEMTKWIDGREMSREIIHGDIMTGEITG